MRLSTTARLVLTYLHGGNLNDAFEASDTADADAFSEAVTLLTGEHITTCDDCECLLWGDDVTNVGCREVCESCLEDNYTRCSACRDYESDDEITHVAGEPYCDTCRGTYCTWCDYCDEYYPDADPHSHSCECEARVQTFNFPANGDGLVANDVRMAVTLPGGIIDGVGLNAIASTLYGALPESDRIKAPIWVIREVIDEIGPEWQTKKGNFTKRLAKAMHGRGVKVPPPTVSEIGNVARAHSSSSTEWEIEFTRDLNQSADAFYHEDSCWWGSHVASRCALKSWGGLGLRSFSEGGRVSGRVWVQPLDEDMNPTHRTEDAHAYLVYNGYGALEDYTPARIVAHLTGKTYRLGKISLSLGPQYVNGESGYLVADQATCDSTDYVTIHLDEHDVVPTTTTTRAQENAA